MWNQKENGLYYVRKYNQYIVSLDLDGSYGVYVQEKLCVTIWSFENEVFILTLVNMRE